MCTEKHQFGQKEEKRIREIIYYEELQELKPYAVELPEVRGPLPDTDESYSFNAARRQNCPVDLEKYGYVEEEFIISGYANVYEYHDVGLYPSREDYLKKVIFSTMKMISDGYLLPEDAPAIIFDRMKERIPE